MSLKNYEYHQRRWYHLHLKQMHAMNERSNFHRVSRIYFCLTLKKSFLKLKCSLGLKGNNEKVIFSVYCYICWWVDIMLHLEVSQNCPWWPASRLFELISPQHGLLSRWRLPVACTPCANPLQTYREEPVVSQEVWACSTSSPLKRSLLLEDTLPLTQVLVEISSTSWTFEKATKLGLMKEELMKIWY